jgi:type I restriction enzyme M protein
MSYGDYVEQLTYLLFLKMADERTKPPYNQPSAVPAKYNWPTLLKKDGDDLFDHYHHMLESLGKSFSPSPLNSSPIEGEEFWRKALSVEKGLLGLIFNKSQNNSLDDRMMHNENWSAI